MKEDLELQLEQDFLFMKKDRISNEHNTYKQWGCECSNGWYQLIHDLCQAIEDRYAEDNKDMDLVVLQIKEKFGALKFYYAFEDAGCSEGEADSVDSKDGRFQTKEKREDDAVRRLRDDISGIVDRFEEKSRSVCEICGENGCVRMDMRWKKTLCGGCYNNYLRRVGV